MQNRTINGSIKVTWLQHKTHIIHICYPRNAAGKKWFVPWPNENTYSLCPRFVRICWLRRSEQHTITYKKHIPCSSLCRARLNHVDWGQFLGCMKCGRKANAQTILNDSQRQLTHKIHRSFIIGEPIILLLASKWPSNQLRTSPTYLLDMDFPLRRKCCPLFNSYTRMHTAATNRYC